jgi:hypothetical protein
MPRVCKVEGSDFTTSRLSAAKTSAKIGGFSTSLKINEVASSYIRMAGQLADERRAKSNSELDFDELRAKSNSELD